MKSRPASANALAFHDQPRRLQDLWEQAASIGFSDDHHIIGIDLGVLVGSQSDGAQVVERCHLPSFDPSKDNYVICVGDVGCSLGTSDRSNQCHSAENRIDARRADFPVNRDGLADCLGDSDGYFGILDVTGAQPVLDDHCQLLGRLADNRDRTCNRHLDIAVGIHPNLPAEFGKPQDVHGDFIERSDKMRPGAVGEVGDSRRRKRFRCGDAHLASVDQPRRRAGGQRQHDGQQTPMIQITLHSFT